MDSSREILRSVVLFVAGLVAMLAAIVVLGLYVERSIGKEPSVLPVSILQQETPLRAALPCARRVGS
jgi:hypothetical protein